MQRSTPAGARRSSRAGAVAAVVIASAATAVVVAPVSNPVSMAADPTFAPIVVPDTVETEPLVSDDGALVVFTSTAPIDPAAGPDAPEAASTLQLHDRRLGTTTPIAAGARWAALSGDGCVIAYGVPVDADPPAAGDPATPDPDGDPATPDPDGDPDGAADAAAADQNAPAEFELRVVDRCAGAAGAVALESTPVATLPVVAPLALDRRGTTLLVNTGADVVRLTRTLATETDPGTAFAEVARSDLTTVATDDSTTAGAVDVSDDGGVVVYQASAVPVPPAATPPPTLVVWQDGVVTPLVADASHPSISGDGRLVAAQLGTRDPATPTGVVVIDRSAGAAPVIVPIDAAGSRPRLSADGAHLIHTVAAGDAPGLRLTSWTGPGTTPFDSVTTVDLGAPAAGAARYGVPVGAGAISRHGEAIAFDDPVSADVVVRSAAASVAFAVGQYDLGTGVVGTELAAAATIVNDGPTTVDLSAATIAAGSPFVVVPGAADSACSGELRPGDTCTVGVAYQVAAPIDVVADLTVTLPGADAPAAVARLSAVGIADTSTTGVTTTTPTSGTTPNTVPNTTPNTRPNPRPTTPNTTRPTVRPTVAVSSVVPLPAFVPGTFDFAPTIVRAGRRVASLAITNPATAAVQVIDVRLDAADPAFTIEPGGDCPGASLASGATCRVDVAFAPSAEGSLTALLTADLSDGTTVSATLSGLGAPTPIVSAVPDVASPGQVVTVRGSGFPAGSLVELRFGAEAAPRLVTVSDVGTFDLPVVVLPKTLPGPLEIVVSGQVDLFPSVEETLLVTVTSNRTSPAVLRGAGPNIGR